MESSFPGKRPSAILPTGSGKSLIYQALPDIANVLAAKGVKEFENKSVVVVVTPLLSIMETQIKELTNLGVPAVNLSDVEENTLIEKEVKEGKFRILFGTPETWIRQEKWYSMLQTTIYQERVLAVVADEAHCLPQW